MVHPLVYAHFASRWFLPLVYAHFASGWFIPLVYAHFASRWFILLCTLTLLVDGSSSCVGSLC
ncbi:hypothetical protein HMPREF1869_00457 [Bacteroidales bacterium KA00251]|nr:hypothetical protein HMPREF1869_00457 [Bacteroidales bacterium KA00251]